MTEEELDRLESLWKQGVKIDDIARELSYSEGTIRYHVRNDRSRFPLRHKYVSDKTRMRFWCYRIMAGRATVDEVAELLHVEERTVRKHMSKIRREEARENAQAGMAQGEEQV